MTPEDCFRILSISDDDGLRYSRELLLLSNGYSIESVTSNTALSVSRVRSFDVVLICRSVDPRRAMAVTEMLRRYDSRIQIMCISPLESTNFPEVDVEIATGPEALLEAIRVACDQRVALRNGTLGAAHQA
jgi:CheY-like chemotaxis protein